MLKKKVEISFSYQYYSLQSSLPLSFIKNNSWPSAQYCSRRVETHLSVCNLEQLEGLLLELISGSLDAFRRLAVLVCQAATQGRDLLLDRSDLQKKGGRKIWNTMHTAKFGSKRKKNERSCRQLHWWCSMCARLKIESDRLRDKLQHVRLQRTVDPWIQRSWSPHHEAMTRRGSPAQWTPEKHKKRCQAMDKRTRKSWFDKPNKDTPCALTSWDMLQCHWWSTVTYHLAYDPH